jgi:hypothetical protein
VARRTPNEDRSNYDRCITRGVAGSILPVIYGNGTDIRQAPGYVVIRNEMIHEARIIPDSRGRFEFDGDTLHYEFTVDDPVIYMKRWTVAPDLATTPHYQIYEYACHEGNYGLANILSAARAEEIAGK